MSCFLLFTTQTNLYLVMNYSSNSINLNLPSHRLSKTNIVNGVKCFNYNCFTLAILDSNPIEICVT